jgi:hypothetical protein
MERLLKCSDDCLVENLGIGFCRFRKASFGGYMDCRAANARVDVWSDRVQVRAGRRSILWQFDLFFAMTVRNGVFSMPCWRLCGLGIVAGIGR